MSAEGGLLLEGLVHLGEWAAAKIAARAKAEAADKAEADAIAADTAALLAADRAHDATGPKP